MVCIGFPLCPGNAPAYNIYSALFISGLRFCPLAITCAAGVFEPPQE
ncbi:hypothetical protein [Tissierella praeacuta]|nr:hypothetical protein [Tissierella praeacuta]